MKKPEPCASVNLGWPPPSGKFGIPNSRNGGRLENGGRLCSCSLSSELMSSEFVSWSFTRTEITAGFTLWTIAAKLGGPARSAGCATAGVAASVNCAAGWATVITPEIAATDATKAKRRSRRVRPDCSELMIRANILISCKRPCDQARVTGAGTPRRRTDRATRLDPKIPNSRHRAVRFRSCPSSRWAMRQNAHTNSNREGAGSVHARRNPFIETGLAASSEIESPLRHHARRRTRSGLVADIRSLGALRKNLAGRDEPGQGSKKIGLI